LQIIIIIVSLIIIILTIYPLSIAVIKKLKNIKYPDIELNNGTQDLIECREKIIDKVFKSKYDIDRKINLRNNKIYDETMFIDDNDLITKRHICDELLVEIIVETMTETMAERMAETIVERIVETMIEPMIETKEILNIMKKEETLTDIEINISDDDDYLYEYREPTSIIPFIESDESSEEYTEHLKDTLIIIPFSDENESNTEV